MNIGDIVKVFSSTSDYDGQTGRLIYITHAAGAPAPFVVQFGDAISEPFSERELVPMKPIEPLWREHPLETHHAPHGASSSVQIHLGRIIAQKFIRSERRRIVKRAPMTDSEARSELLDVLGSEIRRLRWMGIGSPCVQCGKLLCSHR